jgi:hypothetical protein
MTLLLLVGLEPTTKQIHVHNESARNATTTIQAAMKNGIEIVERVYHREFSIFRLHSATSFRK